MDRRMLRRAVAATIAALFVLTGCAAPGNFEGYVKAECATEGDVTTCTSTQLPVPTVTTTVTETVTAAPTAVPTATETPATYVPLGVPGNWTLDFQDEFDGPALDTTKWSSSWWNGASMNNVATSASNVSIVDGQLHLKLSSSTTGALVSTNDWDTPRPGYEFTTGYVEARIFFPGTGWATGTDGCYNWPAFWTNGHRWPTEGENDIAEVLGGKMTVNYHSGSGAHNQGVVPGAWCGSYHTYGLHRMANSSDVYYDGVKVKSYPTDDGNAPQYIILNVGRSGTAVTGDDSAVKVDYVRAWK